MAIFDHPKVQRPSLVGRAAPGGSSNLFLTDISKSSPALTSRYIFVLSDPVSFSHMKFRPSAIVSLFIVFSVSTLVAGQQPTTEQLVAAFKKAIQQSQAELHNFQWIETTTLRISGAMKLVKQNSCSSGADGKILKIPTNLEPAPEKGGARGRINANEKDEISDYMDRAVSLIQRYIPPDPELIRYSDDAGKLDIARIEPDRVARLDFHDFVQPGDLFSGTFDVQSNSITVLHIVTYLDSPSDVVTLGVTFDRWYEGTGYLRKVSLTARAKDVKIVVDYNGYRPN